MSSEQYIEATPVEQEKPLMINDNAWLRMSPIRRTKACHTQKVIDNLRLKASIDIYTSSDFITLKFKSNKTKVYQQALEYLKHNYNILTHLFFNKIPHCFKYSCRIFNNDDLIIIYYVFDL